MSLIPDNFHSILTAPFKNLIVKQILSFFCGHVDILWLFQMVMPVLISLNESFILLRCVWLN